MDSFLIKNCCFCFSALDRIERAELMHNSSLQLELCSTSFNRSCRQRNIPDCKRGKDRGFESSFLQSPYKFEAEGEYLGRYIGGSIYAKGVLLVRADHWAESVLQILQESVVQCQVHAESH